MNTFIWGAFAGYVIRAVVDAVRDIRRARREAKAQVNEARARHGLPQK